MRRQGPYKAKSVPTFAILVADSTPARSASLRPLVASVTAACGNYDAASPDVHELAKSPLTKDQRNALIDAYDNRAVAIKRRLAKMLESLPDADSDLCPYCSLDTNPDLDHFLPKAVYPEFSLHARNLVPICTPCNRKKLNAIKEKGTALRLFLHPSFEPPQNVCVLQANLAIAGNKLTVTYRIDDADVLQEKERAQVTRHYERLGLGARYARRAQSHLASFKNSVRGRPPEAISKTLTRKIADPELGEPVNGWRPALYRAVSAHEAEVLAWLTA